MYLSAASLIKAIHNLADNFQDYSRIMVSLSNLCCTDIQKILHSPTIPELKTIFCLRRYIESIDMRKQAVLSKQKINVLPRIRSVRKIYILSIKWTPQSLTQHIRLVPNCQQRNSGLLKSFSSK